MLFSATVGRGLINHTATIPRCVIDSMANLRWPKATFSRSHSHSRLLKISVRITVGYGGPKRYFRVHVQ